MLVTDRYKYIWNDGDLDELHELKEDPFEMNNIINVQAYEVILKEMRKRLEIWRKKTGVDITSEMIKGRKLKRKIPNHY